MSKVANFRANLIRGAMLLERDRPKEAQAHFQAAIAINPDSAEAYAGLAQCWNELPSERHKVIGAMDRAIGLEPAESSYFGLKGWLLVCQGKYMPALHAAQQGLLLDPICAQSLNAMANAQTHLNRWKDAEETCRRILELRPYDGPGLNLLAQALRHQARWKESREVVMRLLADQPENSFGHANAGYGALAIGDHLRANEHFVEALRMDPLSDFARRGLLSSMRARVGMIRITMRLMANLQRPPTARNLLLALAIFWGAIFLVGGTAALLEYLHPKAGVAFVGLVCIGVLLFVILLAITATTGDFLLIFDPTGRRALTRDEKIQGAFSGFGLVFATCLVFGAGAWKIGVGIVLVFTLLIFLIRLPLMKDRWQRRRQEKAESQLPG